MKIIENKMTGRKVICDGAREGRTNDFTEKIDEDECPFCPVNISAKDIVDCEGRKENWLTCSIMNKFPIVRSNGDFSFKQKGKHEVLIESRNHRKTYFDFSREDFLAAVKLFHTRYKSLYSQKDTQSAIIYKNHLKDAGASKIHSHSQIISFGYIFPEIEKEIIRLDIENNNRENILLETKSFKVNMPEDSYMSGEILITHNNESNFERTGKRELEELSEIMEKVFTNTGKISGKIPFNLYLHSYPKTSFINKFFRWHIHIIPRKWQFGGFELGTGMYVNSFDKNDFMNSFKRLNAE